MNGQDLVDADELEAMLVRTLANDTLNVRMERFERQRRTRRIVRKRL